MMRFAPNRPARGFSLVEVLVALIVVAVGLLGIAKMQALLLADTGVSRLRT
ncbi:type IV pilus modification PilV family protein, partial [Metallibacterium scheffleri]|uniref:type IV pilus modification PilV family protein n=1 Tax=Metallibacterium scheffleri TaxID=993689 RepID=UPI003CCFEE0D